MWISVKERYTRISFVLSLKIFKLKGYKKKIYLEIEHQQKSSNNMLAQGNIHIAMQMFFIVAFLLQHIAYVLFIYPLHLMWFYECFIYGDLVFSLLVDNSGSIRPFT